MTMADHSHDHADGQDAPSDPALRVKSLESLLQKIADQRGFQPENSIVEIKGICGDCAQDDSE